MSKETPMSEKQTRILRLKEKVRDFPLSPGVYLMKNDKDTVIYVGKAKSLRARVRSYFTQSKDLSVKTTYLVGRIYHIDYILTDTEVEAFLLEASLIKKYKPRYNIRLKDDKSYPYIRCTTNHEYPRFELGRKVLRDGGLYFGPYTSGFAVKETIDFINRSYLIRDCKDSDMKARKRPCMTYEIGRCKAPCVGYVTQLEYKKDVEQALSFLRGADKQTLKLLEAKMKAAASDQRFEAAARLRDAMMGVKKIWEKQNVIKPGEQIDKDIFVFVGDQRGTLIESLHARSGRVIGNRSNFIPKLDIDSPDEEVKEWFTSYLNQYYSENFIPDEILITVDLGHDIKKLLKSVFLQIQNKSPEIIFVPSGESNDLVAIAYKNAKSHFSAQVTKQQAKENGLLEIKARFGLKNTPHRIECFDISNTQGAESVASQVVFEEGAPKKSDYRRYKIKTVEGPNDFASMKEVLTRRLEHKEYEDPDLIVVDGGKGQLKIAVEVLKELNRPDIPVVGLAKARTKKGFKESQVEQTQERFFLPGRQNYILFKPHTEAFRILVGLRDEAHRFAITFHRKLRGKAALHSQLDGVSGLGPKKKKTLLSHFTSVDCIKKSSVEELIEVKGINKALAQALIKHLNKN